VRAYLEAGKRIVFPKLRNAVLRRGSPHVTFVSSEDGPSVFIPSTSTAFRKDSDCRKVRAPLWRLLASSARGTPHPNVVALHCDYVSRLPVDFHVFAVEWPVPGSLHNGLRFGISEDDGGFIVHVRIDLGLICCVTAVTVRDAVRPSTSHQIGAVAAEVEKRASAVEFWIGKPVQELRADAISLGPL